ncbi:hypothetical protein J6590_106464, partial [Homalodisca vitripennis]
RKEETWPVPAHSCVLVCCRAVISGASPHSQPCELFILADDDDSSSSDSSDDPSDPESDEELAVPLPMDTDTSTENKMFSK